MQREKGIIFDMDGVLVDAMPFHCKAIQTAAKQEVNIDVKQRDVYLLEGMPGEEMVKELLRQKRYTGNIEEISDGDDNSDKLDSVAHRIHERKKKIFEQINASAPINGAKELISTIRCKKALVSGAAKQEVDSIISKYYGKDAFDVIVTGEDLEEGKPSPDPFRTALTKMGLKESEAIVVENAPLGVKAANNAGIRCIVTLNNTPLKISDFDGLIVSGSIFPNTSSASSFLKEYCETIPTEARRS
ncbi:MAG: HAD family phosphatase [Thermoproteota archaeon]|nr:HAD family phosphatase [Thermoproteota archaeon]